MRFVMLQGRWEKHISGRRATRNQISRTERKRKNDGGSPSHYKLRLFWEKDLKIRGAYSYYYQC